MSFNWFPPAYKQMMKDKERQQHNTINDESSKTTSNISNQRMSNKLSGKGFGVCAILGAVIGIGSFCSSCAQCSNTLGTPSYNYDWHESSPLSDASCQLFGGVGSFFLCIIIGCIVGGIVELIMMIAKSASDKSIDNKIKNERESVPARKQKVTEECNREYEQYAINFEKEAQAQSVKFAESKLAIDIINWMTEGFCKTIDATDRRSHIQKIEVPFSFNVYYNKITCVLGTYDFEIQRCKNLNSVLDQTSLARAIASSIQLNVVMKYPTDPSGTSIKVDIEYSYTTDSAVATLKYSAPNGNYVERIGW